MLISKKAVAPTNTKRPITRKNIVLDAYSKHKLNEIGSELEENRFGACHRGHFNGKS